MDQSLKPIKIMVFYNERVKEITDKDFEEVIVSDNLTFTGFLHFIFSSYPDIFKAFPPGTLAFSLNDIRPGENDLLQDGDIVKIIGQNKA